MNNGHQSAYSRSPELNPVDWLLDILEVFRQQLEQREDVYLRAHSNNPGVVAAHLRCVKRYLPWVKGSNILDWGCYHGIDSWAIRRALGSEVNLHGCDVQKDPPTRFHEASGLEYRYLTDLYSLPYETGSMDTVVGSGVIEHVVNPSESLKELHRVLKENGHLILTFAPNETSLTEMILACVGGHGHPRRYTRRGLRRLLLDHGFLVERCGFHDITPTLTSDSVRWLWRVPGCRTMIEWMTKASPWLERLWPLNLLGQNLYIIGRRVGYVHG